MIRQQRRVKVKKKRKKKKKKKKKPGSEITRRRKRSLKKLLSLKRNSRLLSRGKALFLIRSASQRVLLSVNLPRNLTLRPMM